MAKHFGPTESFLPPSERGKRSWVKYKTTDPETAALVRAERASARLAAEAEFAKNEAAKTKLRASRAAKFWTARKASP